MNNGGQQVELNFVFLAVSRISNMLVLSKIECDSTESNEVRIRMYWYDSISRRRSLFTSPFTTVHESGWSYNLVKYTWLQICNYRDPQWLFNIPPTPWALSNNVTSLKSILKKLVWHSFCASKTCVLEMKLQIERIWCRSSSTNSGLHHSTLQQLNLITQASEQTT